MNGKPRFFVAYIATTAADKQHEVLNLDKLTYAGNLQSLQRIADNPRYEFVQADIADQVSVSAMLARFQPHAIMHLAAESHVDRSIDGPADFIYTNIVGTYSLLEAARVFGDLHGPDGLFDENTPYAPSSPYSASKAAADHLVRAWQRTYGLPTSATGCTSRITSEPCSGSLPLERSARPTPSAATTSSGTSTWCRPCVRCWKSWPLRTPPG
ncbi:hypothetical protein WR25_06802 [Diploscapter pachys]|uniref:NAD(P)-binding domain-containing protein n=1 Tax=Diploscapter pachys TaxID=2018661 RepID=A0A2A2KM99_9BILA|nr:hypothetical protein WR25_06802 [Diploscapter pachys]